MNNKKEKSTFAKITQVVVWTMLVLTIGSVILGALSGVNLI